MTAPFTIRTMDWDDLPRLAGMECPSARAWSYQDLVLAMQSNVHIGVVALRDRQLAGYLFYVVSDTTSLASQRRNRLHLTLGLIHLVVDPTCRRQGGGRFLLDVVQQGLLAEFRPHHPVGRITMSAIVPERNLNAQCFFRACGFTVAAGAIRKDFFDYCDDDGYQFERSVRWKKDRPTSAGAGTPADVVTPAAPVVSPIIPG